MGSVAPNNTNDNASADSLATGVHEGWSGVGTRGAAATSGGILQVNGYIVPEYQL